MSRVLTGAKALVLKITRERYVVTQGQRVDKTKEGLGMQEWKNKTLSNFPCHML